MKREAEQAALAAAPHQRTDVEKRRGKRATAREHDDLPALQRHEEARVAGVRDRGRLNEARREGLESDLRRRLGASARRKRRQREPEKSRELPIDREFLPAG
jgi:hypothetical protein